MVSAESICIADIPELMELCGFEADETIEVWQHELMFWSTEKVSTELDTIIGCFFTSQYLVIRKVGVVPDRLEGWKYCTLACVGAGEEFTSADADPDLISAVIEESVVKSG